MVISAVIKKCKVIIQFHYICDTILDQILRHIYSEIVNILYIL